MRNEKKSCKIISSTETICMQFKGMSERDIDRREAESKRERTALIKIPR